VAAAFIGECPIRYQVNHKDGNPQNNFVDNLEYVTQKENSLHARHVLNSFPCGSRHYAARLTDEIVVQAKAMRQSGMTYQAIANKLGIVTRRTISRAIIGTSWTHVG
jgi:hypothetical protein